MIKIFRAGYVSFSRSLSLTAAVPAAPLSHSAQRSHELTVRRRLGDPFYLRSLVSSTAAAGRVSPLLLSASFEFKGGFLAACLLR